MVRKSKRERAAALSVDGNGHKDDGDDGGGPPMKKACPQSILTKATMHHKKRTAKFAFLEFPGEIRNKIYNNLLCQPGGVVYIGSAWSKKAHHRQATYTPAPTHKTYSGRGNYGIKLHREHVAKSSTNFHILQVCKQVSEEALGILYGQKFQFDGLDGLQHFLLGLPAANIARLRHVDSYGQPTSHMWRFMPVVFSLLRPATSLEFLRVPFMTNFRRGFVRQVGGVNYGHDMTVKQWDILIGCNMGREAYASLYTYLQGVVAEKGAENISRVLHIFNEAFDEGPWAIGAALPGPDSGIIRYNDFELVAPNNEILDAQWTEERRKTMRAAMGEEIARLVADAE